ncbi:hypothetical protein HGRIS_001605 [Hohenbuehelia grisea]|uniref:Uncharacterized protein n=1 Tax=Hohenbuehelia grisea TaxID=104357 RepID=A0ABR3JII6_9AGAR
MTPKPTSSLPPALLGMYLRPVRAKEPGAPDKKQARRTTSEVQAAKDLKVVKKQAEVEDRARKVKTVSKKEDEMAKADKENATNAHHPPTKNQTKAAQPNPVKSLAPAKQGVSQAKNTKASSVDVEIVPDSEEEQGMKAAEDKEKKKKERKTKRSAVRDLVSAQREINNVNATSLKREFHDDADVAEKPGVKAKAVKWPKVCGMVEGWSSSAKDNVVPKKSAKKVAEEDKILMITAYSDDDEKAERVGVPSGKAKIGVLTKVTDRVVDPGHRAGRV